MTGSGEYAARPWRHWYARGVPHEIEIPDVPLTRLLDDAAQRFPRTAALAFLGRTIDYRTLARDVDRFAGSLAAPRSPIT